MPSWEYPNHQGIGCNTLSNSDSANFLSFLQELRQDPDFKQLKITAAVGLTPFAGNGGVPMTDVSGFAAVLDHIGEFRQIVICCVSLDLPHGISSDNGL